MSQSDYLRYKKLSNTLKIDSARAYPVLNSDNYVKYKQYSLENTITNTKPTYNKLCPSGKKVIFDMEKKIDSCPSFLVCANTQSRPNRIPMMDSYSKPIPQPLTIKDTKNGDLCNCKASFGIVR